MMQTFTGSRKTLSFLLSFVLVLATAPELGGGLQAQEPQGAAAAPSGGFAVLASPAQYGDSGIMTFVINQNGVVFQKDLGKATNDLAAAMTEFNPDKSWKPVGE